LYLTSEDVDKTVVRAVKRGATALGPVIDMFWGDRCGTVVDPDGNAWMVETHVAEPTPAGNEDGDEAAGRCLRRIITENLEAVCFGSGPPVTRAAFPSRMSAMFS
jgi:hypothetical protein